MSNHKPKPIVITGQIVEDQVSIQRQLDPKFRTYLPDWIRNKPILGNLEEPDVGVWEGCRLTPEQMESLKEIFQRPGTKEVYINTIDYTLEKYPSVDSFSYDSGALIFEGDGNNRRIFAPWQLPNWLD